MSETDEESRDLPTLPSKKEEELSVTGLGHMPWHSQPLRSDLSPLVYTEAKTPHSVFFQRPQKVALTSYVGFKHRGIHINVKVQVVLEHFNHPLEF